MEKKLKKSTFLVTGGAGFIGSHVAKHLVRSGHEVVVLDDLSGGYRENVSNRATFVEGSILDVALIEELFEKYKFLYVYHLAAYAAEGLSHFIKRFNYNNNVIGSGNLINMAGKHWKKGFVFTFSIPVYGAGQTAPSPAIIPVAEEVFGIAQTAIRAEG